MFGQADIGVRRCPFNSPNFNSPNSNYRVRVRVRVRFRVRRIEIRQIEIRRIEKEPRTSCAIYSCVGVRRISDSFDVICKLAMGHSKYISKGR